MEERYEIETPWGRAACRLNILSGLLAILDLIPALFALGMFFGPPFDGPVSLAANALALLVAVFPAIAVVSISTSHSCIRAGGEWEGFVVSLVPLVFAVLGAVIAIFR